jgi:hypothetical protein
LNTSSTGWSGAHERAVAHAARACGAGLHPRPRCPRPDAGADRARIVLDGKVYDLRITKAGKLILTK